jgi:hypothetical protein
VGRLGVRPSGRGRPGSGQHVRGQRGRPIGVPGAKAGEPLEGVQDGQPAAKRAVELPALRGVELGAAGPDVAGNHPGLQRPRHAAGALGQHAVAEQLRHRQATALQEPQRGDLAGLPGRRAIAQVGLEDGLLADGEDLVAMLCLKQPGRGRAAEQGTAGGLDLIGGQRLVPHQPSRPERTPERLLVAFLLLAWAECGQPGLLEGGGTGVGQDPRSQQAWRHQHPAPQVQQSTGSSTLPDDHAGIAPLIRKREGSKSHRAGCLSRDNATTGFYHAPTNSRLLQQVTPRRPACARGSPRSDRPDASASRRSAADPPPSFSPPDWSGSRSTRRSGQRPAPLPCVRGGLRCSPRSRNPTDRAGSRGSTRSVREGTDRLAPPSCRLTGDHGQQGSLDSPSRPGKPSVASIYATPW